MKDRFGASAVKPFEAAKWQDKVAGYEALADKLFEEGIPIDMFEHCIRFIKGKQRDWKESNMNLVKACLNFMLRCIDSAHRIGRRAASLIIPFLSDKIGDVKFK